MSANANSATLKGLRAESERAARETKREERVKVIAGTESDITTSSGEVVGSMSLAHYHPAKGPAQPVLVEKLGGSQRMIALVTITAAVEAFGDALK